LPVHPRDMLQQVGLNQTAWLEKDIKTKATVQTLQQSLKCRE